MPVYNFKRIAPIPSANEMIDIVLTRTQRKTPTVIHPGYRISRIRSFYMRKVKFTQQTIDEKFVAMLQEFPRLDDIHPFYADLMNILYDRDHYKLALGQINVAKNLISGIAKDYLRLMKYGDSLYRCKQLKRAALGRMCTVIKKLRASLGYLEEVRKHISRLPALDPNTRTLLLCGYPNVGKSSFMNKVTRADVDVQPYAFTTKALFVGHMDHRFLRWQVVDTPGILDRPLEERNTIEMQAVTALAHLQCCILYFLDISEQCGYPIDAQLKLFESIRPLFANKTVLMVANKTDVLPYESLPAHVRAAIEETARTAGAELVPMSNISEENLSNLKVKACDKLLEARVDAKLNAGRLRNDVMGRLTVAQPKPRDGLKRDAFIPQSVQDTMVIGGGGGGGGGGFSSSSSSKKEGSRTTEKDLMWASGGPGVYACDYRKYYTLEEDEWRFDTIPEIMDGKNVMDFFDADIESRLKALEDEEAQLEAQGYYAPEEDSEDDLDEDEEVLYETIKQKQGLARQASHMHKGNNMPKSITARNRSEEELREQLEEVGLESGGVISHTKKEVRSEKRGRRGMQVDGDDENEDGEDLVVSGGGVGLTRSISRGKGSSARAAQETGFLLRGRKMQGSEEDKAEEGGASEERGRSRTRVSKSSSSSSPGRSLSISRDASTNKKARAGEKLRSRSATRGPREGSVAPTQIKQVEKSKRVMERHLFRHAKGGEADRKHYPKLVKHLNSGKRSLGTSTIGR